MDAMTLRDQAGVELRCADCPMTFVLTRDSLRSFTKVVAGTRIAWGSPGYGPTVTHLPNRGHEVLLAPPEWTDGGSITVG